MFFTWSLFIRNLSAFLLSVNEPPVTIFLFTKIFNICTCASSPLSTVQVCIAFGVIRAGEKILCPFTIIRFANIKVSGYIAEVPLIAILTFDYAMKQSTPCAHIGGARI